MKLITFLFCLATAAVVAYHAARADDGNTLPADLPTTVNGIDVACTGIGDEANSDPRWPQYSTRIEFANANAEYLADIQVTLTDGAGEQLLSLRCDSPWFLADLPPGKYTVAGTFQGSLTKTAKFTAPRSGQARIVVRFPEIAGD